MTIRNISLFKALGAKMDYLGKRQRVIAQNVANADTPGYQPQDLKPVNFESALKTITKSKVVTLEATNSSHIGSPNDIANPKSAEQKETYEVAPAGNAVVMEEQMLKAGETVMDYNLMTNLYQKNVGLIKTVITDA